MPLATINGVDLYYEIEGEGDWVVFAHGGEGQHLCWWKQVTALRSRFRCLIYDARGFGLSGGEWGAPEDTAANDLMALLDHLGIERAFQHRERREDAKRDERRMRHPPVMGNARPGWKAAHAFIPAFPQSRGRARRAR